MFSYCANGLDTVIHFFIHSFILRLLRRRQQTQTQEHKANTITNWLAHNTQKSTVQCIGNTKWLVQSVDMYSVSQKKSPPATCGFLTFFHKRLRILHQFFAHRLYVPIYARLQIVIQLSQILTKLCHIKCDYLVHIICSKCPPSAETHTFRRLRKSLIALLIIVFCNSSQICCICNVNKHAGYDMTSTVTSFAQ